MGDVEQPHGFAHPSAHHGQRGSGRHRRASAFDLEEERDGGEHDVMPPVRVRAPFEVGVICSSPVVHNAAHEPFSRNSPLTEGNQ